MIKLTDLWIWGLCFPLVHSKYALEDEQDKDDENVDCSCLADMHLHFCESLLSAGAQLDLCFARTKVDFKLHKVASHKPLCQTHHFALFWDPSTSVPGIKRSINFCLLVLKWPTGVSLSVTQQHLPCCLRPLDVCYCNLQFWRKQCFFCQFQQGGTGGEAC